MLPKAIGNRHLRLAKWSPEDPFDRLFGIDLSRLRQMEIDHRRLQAAVAEILLDDTQADSSFQEMRCVRMAQSVDTNFFAEVKPIHNLLDGFLHRGSPHRSFGGGHSLMVTTIGWEQQSRMTVSGPILPQQVKCRGWQRDVAILGSFAAMHMDQPTRRIHIAHLKIQRFFQSQTHRVDRPVVDGDALDRAGIDDAVDLGDGEYFR